MNVKVVSMENYATHLEEEVFAVYPDNDNDDDKEGDGNGSGNDNDMGL